MWRETSILEAIPAPGLEVRWRAKVATPGRWWRSVALSPRWQTLATGSADWTVRLWDLTTQKERAVLKEHQGGVHCLSFSSDSSTLATGGMDETVKLWDVAAGKERATLLGTELASRLSLLSRRSNIGQHRHGRRGKIMGSDLVQIDVVLSLDDCGG